MLNRQTILSSSGPLEMTAKFIIWIQQFLGASVLKLFIYFHRVNLDLYFCFYEFNIKSMTFNKYTVVAQYIF